MSQSRSSKLNVKSYLAASTALLTLAALWSAPAHAQEAARAPDGGDAVTEVIVTGSRIARRDFTSQSPIVTLQTEQLRNTSSIALEQQLSRLPQFVPGSDQFGQNATNAFATALQTPGAATLNLRGLGSNRNLILLDGRRAQPINATLAIDLNTLPTAAIDGVEVISGGAAATYGSDAISGVVNFKLKHNYQGMDLDAHFGESFRGYGREVSINGLIGGNFANDKGNAMVGFNFADRTGVYQRDIPFFRRAYTDPTVAGDPFLNAVVLSGYENGQLGSMAQFSQAALDAVFGPGQVLRTTPASFGSLGFNPAATTAGATLFWSGRAQGTSTVVGAPNGVRGLGFTGLSQTLNGVPLVKVAETSAISGLVSPQTGQLASLPLRRWSGFAKADYDVNDNVKAYVQTSFAQTATRTVLGWNAATAQFGGQVPFDSATCGVASAHPVPDAFCNLLRSRTLNGAPIPDAPWAVGRGLDLILGPRGIVNDTTNYQVLGGFTGKVGISDWTFDVYGSHGKTTTIAEYKGFGDIDRYRTLLASPNYGAGFSQVIPNRGITAHCTSGINPFVNSPVSQDCIDIINAPLTNTTELTQDIFEATIQGKAFDAPAGEVRFAAGMDYRKDNFVYRSDSSTSPYTIGPTGTSNGFPIFYEGGVLGYLGTASASGQTGVWEGYGEVSVPVVKDLPLAKRIELNLGYRYSDYNITSVGGVSTWKALGDWAVTDWMRLRGGFQRASRAPNTAELFQGGIATVASNPGDPCIPNQRTYGNGGANTAAILALCSAQTGGALPPSFFTNFAVASPVAINIQIETGNRNLKAEVADTWTIGTVLRSPVRSPLLDRLTLSIDYYNIKVTDAIALANVATVWDSCFNAYGNNPTYSASNPYCQRIVRNPATGLADNVIANYDNLPGLKTSGIDFQLDWSVAPRDVGIGVPGTLNLNVSANYLKHFLTSRAAGAPYVEYAGTNGDTAFTGGFFDPQFKWKTTTTVTYSVGGVAAMLRWRHLPSIVNATNPLIYPTGAYDLLDTSVNWNITEKYQVRAGIDNLLNADPPVTTATPAAGINNASSGAGSTYPSAYDVLGRRFYVALHARF